MGRVMRQKIRPREAPSTRAALWYCWLTEARALVRIRILKGMTIHTVYRHSTSIFAQ